jgi:integrase
MPRGERGTARPYLRGATWWIRYSVPGGGGERFESSKSTEKKDALRLLHDRLKEIDQRQIGPKGVTVRNLLDLHLRDLKIRRLPSYKANEGYVRNHLEPALGRILADRLTTDQISDFIEKKQGQGLEDATINRFLEALRKGYHLGRDASPALVARVPRFRMLELDNVREGTLEPEEYRHLLGFLPFYLQMVLVIGYHWGMRRGEILKLRWDQVDWAAGVVRLERNQTKGKQARVAPIYGELRGWLERAYLDRREGEETIVSYRAEEHDRRPGENTGRPRKPGGLFETAEAWGVTPKTARRILDLNLEGDELAAELGRARKISASRLGRLPTTGSGRRGGPLPSIARPRSAGKSVQSIKTAWETARKAAGVPELLVHDLRRTAARNMIQAGLSEKEAMKITGHKTTAMFRRYTIVDERDMVEAGRKMEAWAAGAEARGKKKPAAAVEISKSRLRRMGRHKRR